MINKRIEKNCTINLKEYGGDPYILRDLDQTIGARLLAQSMTPENFVAVLDDFLNLGGKQYTEGRLIGQALQASHPTLQRSAVAFALGIIAGISEQNLDWLDARNKQAIETAKKITSMIEENQLPLGLYL